MDRFSPVCWLNMSAVPALIYALGNKTEVYLQFSRSLSGVIVSQQVTLARSHPVAVFTLETH